jgi:hypothetical protein
MAAQAAHKLPEELAEQHPEELQTPAERMAETEMEHCQAMVAIPRLLPAALLQVEMVTLRAAVVLAEA